MYSPQKIQTLVENAFPGATVIVRDLTGTQDHYEVTVVSSDFAGKNPVARHRMVYAALGSSVGGEIHALALKTHTPEEIGE